jgi:hypothetical protein
MEWGTGDSAGLTMADLVEDFRRRGLMVQVVGSVEVLSATDPHIEREVLRAIREALHNTSKYAGVDEAHVMFSQQANMLTADVCDRGVGLEADWRKGYGLRQSVERRIQDVGGVVDIISKPDGGTTVSIRVTLAGRNAYERFDNDVRRWFPIIPLSARLLVLPFVVFKVEPLLDRGQPWLHLLVGGIAVAHGVLVAKLARQEWAPRKRTSICVAFCVDMVVAGGLYLVTAADEHANETSHAG